MAAAILAALRTHTCARGQTAVPQIPIHAYTGAAMVPSKTLALTRRVVMMGIPLAVMVAATARSI